ncbi:hypothetical protein ECP03047775_2927, partial [Escherichia coli P0304777.5]
PPNFKADKIHKVHSLIIDMDYFITMIWIMMIYRYKKPCHAAGS